jgi:hypothetical protein
MLNTKLLLIIIALLASIGGYVAYQHRQEVAREEAEKRVWNQVQVYRQKEAAQQARTPKAKDVLQYRVP